MTTNALATALKALADAQRAQDSAAQDADDRAAAMRATTEGRAATSADARLSAARAATHAAHEVARAAILVAYEATGNKKPAPGAGVRISKGILNVVHNDNALAWAEEHMPAAILKTLDADLLAAWAARQPALPAWMVRTPDKATPTIASNLAELYPEA